MMNHPENGRHITRDEAGKLFVQHIDFIRGIAARNAPQKSLIEDIVNDTYIHFVKNAEMWQYHEEKILSLFKTITLHMAARHWQNYLKNLPTALRNIAEHLRRVSQEYGSDRHHAYSDSWIQALKSCMHKLSPVKRELMEQIYFQEVSYEELAQLRYRSLSDDLPERA